ncbi:MAG: hypothetical protein AAGF12_06075 [Myxococcota bacterium]
MNRLFGLSLAMFVLMVAPTAEAQDPVHDSIYLRGSLGVGFDVFIFDDDALEANITGFILPIELVAGYAVIPNLIVNFHAVLLPQLAGGGSVESPLGETDIDGVTGFGWFVGAGGTYYLTPIDIYFGASIGFGEVDGELEIGSVEADIDTDIGFGFNLTAGKTFPLSPELSAGVGFVFQFLTLPPDVGDGDNTVGLFFGLMGTVTLN